MIRNTVGVIPVVIVVNALVVDPIDTYRDQTRAMM